MWASDKMDRINGRRSWIASKYALIFFARADHRAKCDIGARRARTSISRLTERIYSRSISTGSNKKGLPQMISSGGLYLMTTPWIPHATGAVCNVGATC